MRLRDRGNNIRLLSEISFVLQYHASRIIQNVNRKLGTTEACRLSKGGVGLKWPITLGRIRSGSCKDSKDTYPTVV
jgi:hypothetical protein